MKKLSVIIAFVFLVLSLTSCEKEFLEVSRLKSYSDNTYYLDITLDDDLDKLTIEGSIVYINDKIDFDEIYLTLFSNAYNRDSETEDNVVFEYLKINDIDYNIEFSGVDNTSIHIDLEETLKEGKNHLIEFKYDVKYWDLGRFGKLDDDYYITMFFYPYVSVYDEFGWNIEPYTFKGESYYNEIGDYYVKLNIPDDYLVACSGEVIKEEILEDGTKDIYYTLENGRDFSFSASTDYYHYERLVDDVTFEIYALGELTLLERNHSFDYLEQAFSVYSGIIGEYDYNHFTLEYGLIYGMESTGVIYCSREIDEGTVVHEVIHQWFYSMIGNDQSDYSFIDESLTTFSTGFYYNEIYGQEASDEFYYIRSSYRPDIFHHFEISEGTDMLRKVDEYGDEYAYIIYYHGVSMFKYYIDYFLDGDYELFKTFMHAYYETYKHEVVTLDQFLNLLEETTQVEDTYEWFMLMLNEFQHVYNMPE
ncbi:M1 family aminopeptidase [Candidatus Izemoplasma sp. B36]|uniref:M1 family aminopeptidase n=1 Tax=Candidatus Izemoplasma sp. B36 TaxID=3242468 RepID=UPI003558150E